MSNKTYIPENTTLNFSDLALQSVLIEYTPVITSDYIDEPSDDIIQDKGVVVFILVCIMAVSVIANSFIIFVISKERQLHRAPYYYLLCITVMDMFKSIFCLAFVIEVVLNDFRWVFQQGTCIALAFETSFYTICTALGLVAIAIDRYMSLSAAKMYSKCLRVYWNRIVIATGCGVAFCISFPPVFEKETYRFVPLEMQCTLYHLPYRENRTFGYTLTFICMLLLTLFLYGRLFLFMRSHRRMVPVSFEPARSPDWTFGHRTNGQVLVNHVNGIFTGPLVGNQMFQNVQRDNVNNSRKHKKESRLFFTMSVCFAVLWVPYLFQTFVKVFRNDIPLPASFIISSTLLSFSHVAVSPVLALTFASPIRSSLATRFSQIVKWQSYTGVPTTDKT